MKNKIERGIVFLMILFLSCASSTVVKTTENGHYTVELIIRGKTLIAGKNVVNIKVVDAKGTGIDDADIEVTPWMPEMGHGVMLVPRITEESGGMYRVEDIYFNMEGLWELKIKIQKDNIKDSVVFEFPEIK